MAPEKLSAGYYAPAFLDCNRLIGRHMRELVYLPAGPFDLEGKSANLLANTANHILFVRIRECGKSKVVSRESFDPGLRASY